MAIDIRYKSGSSWVSVFYPVGSFYFSTKNTSPASTLGGSWTQVSNAAIRGVSSGSFEYKGADTFTLTTSHIPSHDHAYVENSRYCTNASGTANAVTWGNWATNGSLTTGYRTGKAGGGLRTQLCNVHSIALFGIEQLKSSFPFQEGRL